MGDLIQLKKPEEEELVLMCSECGCTCWHINSDKTIECTHCHDTHGTDAIEWAYPAPAANPPTGAKIFHENPDIADFMVEDAKRWITGGCVAVMLSEDGLIHTFNGITPNKLSRKWLNRQLKEAGHMIKANKK